METLAFLVTWLILGVFVGWGVSSAAKLGGTEDE